MTKYINHIFDEDWYEGLQQLINDDGDTTTYDNQVIKILKNTTKWDLETDTPAYDKPGIWVSDEDFPYNFTVVDPQGNIALSYI